MRKPRMTTTEFATEITVKRKVQEGWHVYTCDMLPGLYVASKDGRAAYDDVPGAIQKLLELNFGIKCSVVHKLEYGQFLERMALSERARSAVQARTDDMMESALEPATYYSFIVQSCDNHTH